PTGLQLGDIRLTSDDCSASFGHTFRAQRIGGSRKSQRGRAAFVALQQLSRSPFRSGQLAFRNTLVDGLECLPEQVRCTRNERRSGPIVPKRFRICLSNHVFCVHSSATSLNGMSANRVLNQGIAVSRLPRQYTMY